MSVESNKAMVRKVVQAFNSPDWEREIANFTMINSNPEQQKQFVTEHRAFRKAFPDYHAEILELFGEGDKVAVVSKITGTHRAEFPYYELKGVRATDLKLEWNEVQIFEFQGDAFDVPHFMVDGVGRLKQLGVLP